MKQRDLDSMSIDELCVLHVQVTATLAARISVERDALLDQLKHADMSVHQWIRDLRRPGPISHTAMMG
jgi:hypothetical protein